MSVFPGSQAAYETLMSGGAAMRNYYGYKPKTWNPNPELPEVDASPERMEQAKDYTQKSLDNQSFWRKKQASRPVMSMQPQSGIPKVNAAPSMDAWRERRSQVGAVKRQGDEQRKVAMQQAMQQNDGRTHAQRMTDLGRAQRKGRIWA
jgi:hypothetical protein